MKRLKRKNEVIPDWLSEAIRIMRPPEKLTVSEWADKYRILDSKTSAEPGPWRTQRTPYLRGIMDALNDPEIEEIIFTKPTQVGGTEALNNIIGYIIAQDPSPALIVYPTLDLAEYTSKNRIQPMIKACEATKGKYHEDASKMLELQFEGMYLVLSGANSPASLASRPIRYLLLDEVDKYPTNAGKEADPISLARERTKTFNTSKKIFLTSTPTLKTAPIWQAWENADTQCHYFVPCPYCGNYQILRFKQIKFKRDEKTPDEAYNTAYYECEACKGVISDAHKLQMLSAGEWRAEKKMGKRRTAFHMNALYSPWLKFGDVAYEFVRSKNSPELLMNFINSWLAEPWEETEVKLNSDKVLERRSIYEEGVVPDDTLLITAGVDVQKDHFYFTIRAWGLYMTSYNIRHGIAYSWDEVEQIMNLPYQDRNGKQYQVNLCAVDSGDQTDDVYEFCVHNQEWAIPIKGSSRPMNSKYNITTIDKINSKAFGMRLCIVDGGQYKDMIAGRMQRPNGQGSWMTYAGCDREYAEQICSEEKVKEKRSNMEVYVWRPKSTHAANHYLDAEVYAALAADLLGVRYLQPTTQQESETPRQQQEQQSNSFIKAGSWLNQGGNWIR